MCEHITWLLLSTNNPGRGPETYGDAKGIYRWNNRVPNSKQLAVGNRVVIADNRNDKIIALGSIARIDTSEGTSTIDRCPSCNKTSQLRLKRHVSLWNCPKCKLKYSNPLKESVATVFYTGTIFPYLQYAGHHNYADVKRAGNELSQLAMRRMHEQLIPPEIKNEFARLFESTRDLAP